MALMTPQVLASVLTPAFTAPQTTDTIDYQDDLILYVKVGATATTITVQIPSTEPYTGVATPDLGTGSVTSGERVFAIPKIARDPATGLVTVTYSQVANVTSALILARQPAT